MLFVPLRKAPFFKNTIPAGQRLCDRKKKDKLNAGQYKQQYAKPKHSGNP